MGWPLRVHLQRPVHVHFPQPDREQLHQLARIVLVRRTVRRRLAAVGQIEILAHRRTERHVAHQGAEVAEGVPRQQPHPRRELFAAAGLVGRHDDELAEREDHSLAQLIGRVGHVEEQLVAHAIGVEAISERCFRKRELIGKPGSFSACLHGGDVRGGGTEGGELQELGRGVGDRTRSLQNLALSRQGEDITEQGTDGQK